MFTDVTRMKKLDENLNHLLKRIKYEAGNFTKKPSSSAK
jgi:hypothetical protein